jgi:phage tail-like protein
MKRIEIQRLLPGVFQQTARPRSPLVALLDAMEELHAPAEEILATLDTIFDPRRTRDEFVPYLSGWVDLDWLLEPAAKVNFADQNAEPISSGLGRLRELVATAARLSQLRGTAKGLIEFLSTATGEKGFKIDENTLADGQPRAFHIRVSAPAAARPHGPLIKRIIESEKPAHVTYELTFKP